MFDIFNDYDYESTKVGRSVINDIIISTCNTPDEGYETALIGSDGEVSPVERYSNISAARIGHEKWKEFAKDGKGKTITKLGGLYGLVEDNEVILK